MARTTTSTVAALLLLFLGAAQGQPMATHGVTDGEPGNNVEAHCCGMKGLGGAKVDVMCHPQMVGAGQRL